MSSRQLGANQQIVLYAIAVRGGVTDVAAGTLIHDHRGCPCHANSCAERGYLDRDGRSVLRSLRTRGLVRRRKADGLWVSADAPVHPPAPDAIDPALTAFPEGF